MGEDAGRESVAKTARIPRGTWPRRSTGTPAATTAGRRQPRLPRAPADVGEADGAAGPRSGLRLLDLGCGTGASTAALLDAAPAGRDRRGGRVGGDAGAGPAQDLAAAGALRARRRRGPGARRGAPARSTASWPPTCCATCADRTPRCASSTPCCGRARRWPCTSTRCATRRAAGRVWTAVCWAVIIPMGRLRTGSSDLYRYLWRSVLDFDGVRGADRAAATRPASTTCGCRRSPGWQQHIVHTFLGRRPGEPLGGTGRPTPPPRRSGSPASTPDPSRAAQTCTGAAQAPQPLQCAPQPCAVRRET